MRFDEGKLLPVKAAIRENKRWAHGAPSREAFTHRWGVILAGGDGLRLRRLTRMISGDDRPKQFCHILGEGTLVEVARQRAERSIKPDQVVYSVTRSHREYYVRDLAGQASQRVVQPCNKGTAPAIISSLLRIARMDRDATVAILPCDHHYADERVFTEALEAAYGVAEDRPQSVVLLGAQPRGPEVEYGWIEVDKTARGANKNVFQVVRFHEKPALPVAERLLRSGCLWNTFVMVGKINAFLEIAIEALPGVVETLHSVPMAADAETRISDQVYNRIEPADFSRQVLTPAANRLLTLPLCNAGWNDLGDPERVMSVLLQHGEAPLWATRWRIGQQDEHSRAQAESIAVA